MESETIDKKKNPKQNPIGNPDKDKENFPAMVSANRNLRCLLTELEGSEEEDYDYIEDEQHDQHCDLQMFFYSDCV